MNSLIMRALVAYCRGSAQKILHRGRQHVSTVYDCGLVQVFTQWKPAWLKQNVAHQTTQGCTKFLKASTTCHSGFRMRNADSGKVLCKMPERLVKAFNASSDSA